MVRREIKHSVVNQHGMKRQQLVRSRPNSMAKLKESWSIGHEKPNQRTGL